MAPPRNFFRLRTAEQSQTDDQFLALFSSKVVDLLDGEQVWDRLVRFESAPGGGKSSLLRLFSPGSLSRIFRSRNQPDSQGLAKQLNSLGVMDKSGPTLLGVYINCNQDYGQISEQNLSKSEKLTWFLSLLDARITLITLKTICQLVGLRFPDDIKRITFTRRADNLITDTAENNLGGVKLYDLAREMESTVGSAINRLGRTPNLDLKPKGRLDLPSMLSTHSALVDGKPIVTRVLLMFDDTHALEHEQQEALGAELRRHDLLVSRWMALRLTALTPMQIMSETSKTGREVMTIRLDEYTRRSFEPWARDVANRRAVRAESTIGSFQSLLSDELTSKDEREAAEAACDSERTNALKLVRQHPDLFGEWVERTDQEAKSRTPVEAATLWSLLQILAERRLRRRQSEFDFASLPSSDLAAAPSDDKQAARLFVAKRGNLPYYFGAHKVAQLGSKNIEQFLAISGDLFDAILNGGILSRSGSRQLTAHQQDQIIRATSKQFLANIRRDVPYGSDVHNLVTAMGSIARSTTYHPRASYSPGITGFALSMTDRDMLLTGRNGNRMSGSGRLLRALHAAITHSILSPVLDHKTKGRLWMVLYLNRLLCPVFDLPLGYGGFKEQSLGEVEHWVMQGTPQAQKGFEFN